MSVDFFKEFNLSFKIFWCLFCYIFFLTLLNTKDHLRICEGTQEVYKHSNP